MDTGPCHPSSLALKMSHLWVISSFMVKEQVMWNAVLKCSHLLLPPPAPLGPSLSSLSAQPSPHCLSSLGKDADLISCLTSAVLYSKEYFTYRGKIPPDKCNIFPKWVSALGTRHYSTWLLTSHCKEVNSLKNKSRLVPKCSPNTDSCSTHYTKV